MSLHTLSSMFQNIFQDVPVAIYICDTQGNIVHYNQEAEKLWGRKPIPGKDFWCGALKVIRADGSDMKITDCPLAKVILEGAAPYQEEVIIERPNKQFSRILVSPKPLFDEKGDLVGGYNTLLDITEKNLNETKQAIFSRIVESSEDAIISKDLKGNIMSWNKGAQKIFGYREDEILGQSIYKLIPKDRHQEEEEILSSIRNGKEIEHFETARVDKWGKEIAISLTVSPIKNIDGKIIGASKIARNVTEQVKAKKAILQYNKDLEILNSIGRKISEKLDVDTILQIVTDAATDITGAAFGAFFYHTVNHKGEAYMLFSLSGASKDIYRDLGMPRNTDVFHPTYLGRPVRVDDITKDPRYGRNAPYAGMPEGHLKVVSYMAIPVTSTSGKVIGSLLFGHPEPGKFTAAHQDMVMSVASQAAVALDHWKLFEEIKAISAKKDEFIALASHELKTPITTIKGYLQVIARNEKDDTASAFIAKALNQVNKLNVLIEDLLSVSKIEVGKLVFHMEDVDMKELISDITEIFEHTYTSHKILTYVQPGAHIVRADRQRVEQALTNLLNNAVKYSPNAQEVKISLSATAQEATVCVIDKGIGLTTLEQQQIFSRFFRVEGSGHISGLGLGLYLSKQIIDRLGGRIGVSSEPGKGSIFFFTLPLKTHNNVV